jgi:DNA-nicking Smr family endonuclease
MKGVRKKLVPHKRSAAAPLSDGTLSDDERALWSHVAASIARISVKARITRPGPDTFPDDAAAVAFRKPAPHVNRPTHGRAPPHPAPAHPAHRIITAPAGAELEPRKIKKIAKGRLGIEARLDLHGLRQDEAHMRLRYFVRDCYGRGLKYVLVITGKGRETDDATLSFGDMMSLPPRGVLRRNVPRWLADPELHALVVGFTSAMPKHGGDGAFYIELRRSK